VWNDEFFFHARKRKVNTVWPPRLPVLGSGRSYGNEPN
jgi:hypothetical protein